MPEEKTSLKQIIKYRKEKLEELRENGVDPYPHVFNPAQTSSDILDNFDQFENQTVSAAGRIMSVRKMGKACFCHIQDKSGRIQVYVRRDDVGEQNYTHFKLFDLGDHVGVEGYVFKTKTGEISIHAETITILSKSIRPLPVVKEKDGEIFHAFTDKEQRYRQRHLDLIVNPEVKDVFVKRSKIIQAIRNYLDKLGFLEVETPILQPLYGGANARPFTTYHNALDQQFYLRIADELYLKRLIIGGFDKVYEMSKDFRNEGIDRNHNPEFTMLEWYEAYADYEKNMETVEALIKHVAESLDITSVTWNDVNVDFSKPFSRKPIFELTNDIFGMDLSVSDEKDLSELCKKNNIEMDKDAPYGQLLDELMKHNVEPTLTQPTFVTDYPKAISPLAKKHRNGNPELVERFELFICGTEFANSFTELNDPIDQRERFEMQGRLLREGDEEAHPVDEQFLEAMETGMPPTGGVGIGIDRLVMLMTEQRWIKDVILFPTLRSV
jgi:lysyl-tRNA synthetase class 2